SPTGESHSNLLPPRRIGPRDARRPEPPGGRRMRCRLRSAASALGPQHRARALLRPAAARPDLLQAGGVGFVQRDAVVVGEFLAGLDRALGFDEDAVLARILPLVLLEHRLAVRLAAVVDPARAIALEVGVDDLVVVEGEEERVAG